MDAPVTPRHAVVTGATSGIGRWIARGLAEAGFSLSLIGRDAARAAATRDWISGAAPGATIDLHETDLSSLRATRAVAAEIAARHPAIAVLVNNAGLLCQHRMVTEEGHEKTLATNLLSPLALTDALLPALAAGAPARVVMVGSSTSDRASLDPANLELTRGWGMSRAYARSKLALLMMSRRRAESVAAMRITINVVHPGLVATGLVRHGGIDALAWTILGRFALTPQQGADTPLYACLSPEMAGRTGLYLKRRRAVPPNRRALDATLVAELERRVAAMLGEG